jgi:pantothenate kinase
MGEVIGVIATAVSAVASVASTVYSVTRPSPHKPKTIMPTDTTAEQAAYAEAEQMRKRRGAASTMLTGPGGVQGQPTTLKSQLGA